MTKVLSRGISTGAEPRQVKVRRAGGVKPDGGKDESFGTKRAAIIQPLRGGSAVAIRRDSSL